MTERVISTGGVPVTVATLSDIENPSDLPLAEIDKAGVVKKTLPVADVQTFQVTDIESAALAIAAIGTTLAELMQAMRNSGQMERN